ncbi:MAG: antibiotic biosynthesis monooxygenase family protein [Novosphingobium sp.]
MITEIATITISAGNEGAFEAAMRDGGLAHLAACPGVGSVKFGRGVENPANFAFVVEWDSLEAHAAAKDTDSFRAFRAAMGTWAVGGSMEHFAL